MDRVEVGGPDQAGVQEAAIQMIGLVMARAVGDAEDRLRIFSSRYGPEGLQWLAAYLHHVIDRKIAIDHTVEQLLTRGILPILDLGNPRIRAGVAAAQDIRELLGDGDMDRFATRCAGLVDGGLIRVMIWALLGVTATVLSMSAMADAAAGLPSHLAFPVPVYGHPNRPGEQARAAGIDGDGGLDPAGAGRAVRGMGPGPVRGGRR